MELRPITVAEERELQDAFNVVLDICHRIVAAQNAALPPEKQAGPGGVRSAVVCMAVQTAFMVENIGREDPDVILTPDVAIPMYRGLGMGVGHCLGAMSDMGGRILCHMAVLDGLKLGLQARETTNSRPRDDR